MNLQQGIFLWIFLNYAPHASLRLPYLCISTPYVLYALSCLACLRTVRALVPPYPPSRLRALCALLTRFTWTPCTPSLRALCGLSTRLSILFAHLKVFSGWLCNPSKKFNFPKTIKDTTNRAAFMWIKKETFYVGKFFKHI